MKIQLKSIVITPEQIIAAAALIRKDQEDLDTAQCTDEQWAIATEHWLRVKLNELLVDVDWNARSGFEIEPKCDYATCQDKPLPHSIYCQRHNDNALEDGEKGYTMPIYPTVVRKDEDRSVAIVQRRELAPEPDGNVLWA